MGMFPVVISQNVDKMPIATIMGARQDSPNNWVFLVVALRFAGLLLRMSFPYIAFIRPLAQDNPIGRTDVSDDPCNACFTTKFKVQ